MSSHCQSPDITVLLPAYNAEPFITEAVMSILQQSYTNFVLLIIDDGSTDRTGEILEELASRDGRIALYRRENRGLIATLNEGLSLCRTELVARMDADDIALPDRLVMQKDFMDAHPGIVVCGSDMVACESGKMLVYPRQERCPVACLFGSPLAHPTVIFRKSIVESLGGYGEEMLFAEDYDLWARIIANGLKMANIPQPLLVYREHPQVDRFAYRCRSMLTTQRIWVQQLQRLGICPTPGELDSHAYCAAPCKDIAWRQKRAHQWLEKLCACNRRERIYDQAMLEGQCADILRRFPQPVSFAKAPLFAFARLARLLIASLFHDTTALKTFLRKLRRVRK